MARQVEAQGQAGSEGVGRHRVPAPFLLLSLLVGVLLISAGNASAAGWHPAVNASAAIPSEGPWDVMSMQDVAVDGEGNAIAVWVQATIAGTEVIRAATRPVGGSWSKSVPLSNPVAERTVELQLVVDPEGNAAAIWIGYGNFKEVVRAATRPAGGEWSEPVALSDEASPAVQPDLAIDDEGTVTVIWVGNEEWEEGVVEAATHPADGDWSEPVELSDESRAARSPEVAVDQQGEVTAVWVLNTGSRDDGVIQSTTRPAGGEWSEEPVDVSGEDGLASLPRIAVDAAGDATVVWQQQDIPAPSGFRIFVQTAHRVDGTWSEPLSITREDWISTNPELTVDQQGNVTAIWTGGQPGTATRHLTVRSRSAAGSWGEPFNLVTKNGLVEPGESDFGLAADAEGNVTAIWTAWAVPTYVVRSARLPFGGTWSTPATVSSASGYALWPQLAVDPQGYATVVWSGYQAGLHAVRSRVFDPVAPELHDLEVPTTGTVGQPVAMSVDPFDVWSPVVTAWAFGDGRSGTGAAVSHCYSSPGEHTVTVTGTDAAANATSESRTISIEPDPAFPAGSDPCEPEPPVDPEPPHDPGLPDPPKRPDSDTGHGATAPVVSELQQSSARWRTPGTRSRSRLPIGTTFRFELDRPAMVRLAFSRVVPGREEGERCVKATKANLDEPRCNRYQARGALEIDGRAEENSFAFRGRIRGRMLEPGRYRLLVTAHADSRTSPAAPIEFTIVR
jgi:PKD domain